MITVIRMKYIHKPFNSAKTSIKSPAKAARPVLDLKTEGKESIYDGCSPDFNKFTTPSTPSLTTGGITTANRLEKIIKTVPSSRYFRYREI